MDVHFQIGLIGFAWIALIILFQQYSMMSRLPTLGAPLAFLLVVSLNHLGALVHTDPDYIHWTDPFLAGLDYDTTTVLSGFAISLVGILGFIMGALFLGLAIPRWQMRRAGPPPDSGGGGDHDKPPYKPGAPLPDTFRSYAQFFILVGLSSYFLPIVVPSFPGADAFFGAIRLSYIAGVIGLVYWYRVRNETRLTLQVALVGAAAPPLFGLLQNAVFGDTLAEGFLILTFYLGLARPSYRSVFKATVLLLIVGYAVFYLATIWMAARGEVRSVVWGRADFSTRVEATVTSLGRAVGNIDNRDVQYFLDMRLNQNIFIGKSKERLDAGLISLEGGQTLLDATKGWIPRAVWPDKPTRGGSDFIDRYTGKETSGAVSYGVGAIMEFFVNFRTWGVLLGMFMYGMLLRYLDFKGAAHLRRGSMRYALPWIMVSVPFISAFYIFFFLVNELFVIAIIALFLRIIAPMGAQMVRSFVPKQMELRALRSRSRRT